MSRYIHDKTNHELIPVSGFGSRVATTVTGKKLTVHSSLVNIQGYNYGNGDISTAVEMIATIESSLVASKNYSVGDRFVYNGVLYVVTDDIDEGDNLILNTNYEASDGVAEIVGAAEAKADAVESQLTVGSDKFYFDSHDGKYGYNTSPTRGADTFVPFKSGVNIIDLGTLTYSYSGVTTFTKNITSYTNDYSELTVDNFFPREIGHYLDSGGKYYPSFTRSYDATTGVITYSVRGAERSGTAATGGSFHVYLIF